MMMMQYVPRKCCIKHHHRPSCGCASSQAALETSDCNEAENCTSRYLDSRMVVCIQTVNLMNSTLTRPSVVIISIIRLYFLILVAKHPTDQTWYSGPAAYWSALEVNLAIVCASTPALKPLVVKIMPMFGTRFGTSKRSHTHSHSTQDSRSNGFMRLKGKPSHSTINNGIQLEHDITALPHAYRQSSNEHWKEIHVTHRSMRRGRVMIVRRTCIRDFLSQWDGVSDFRRPPMLKPSFVYNEMEP
jgi:hypothetical protein